jgi:hypothetical protein
MLHACSFPELDGKIEGLHHDPEEPVDIPRFSFQPCFLRESKQLRALALTFQSPMSFVIQRPASLPYV